MLSNYNDWELEGGKYILENMQSELKTVKTHN